MPKAPNRTYQINISITSQEDENVGDDWCFDVDVPMDKETLPLHGQPHINIPYALITIAKDAAMEALNKVPSVAASCDSH